MLCFQLALIFGLLTTSIRADCAAADNPRRVIECVRYITTGLYGAIIKDLRLICGIAEDIARCVSVELRGCVAAEVGQASLSHIELLARECCPDRNKPRCPIRESNVAEQKCFAADSLVTLADGQQKTIGQLQPGDALLTYHQHSKQLISTPLITIMDFQPHRFALFKHITTSTGRQLSLTSSHLLPTPQHGYLMAKHLHQGMTIFVLDDQGVLIKDTVSNVTDVVKQGYMAPLTFEGTLIVNNVAASCYATINSHHVAHAVLAPMRWWYSLFGVGAHEKVMVGVHWFPKMLYDITASILPSIIQQ